jgi:hypothetical protein
MSAFTFSEVSAQFSAGCHTLPFRLIDVESSFNDVGESEAQSVAGRLAQGNSWANYNRIELQNELHNSRGL